MVSLIYLIIFLTLVFSIGKRATTLLKFKFSKIEEVYINIAVGSGAIMLLTFFLGALKLLYKWIFLVLALLIAIFLFKEIKYFGFLIGFLSKKTIRKLKPDLFGFLLVIFVFFVIINLMVSFAPVFSWDVTSYHLVFPKKYIRHHSLAYGFFNMYEFTPAGMSILYIISEMFSPGNFSLLIAYSFAILGSIGIYSIARRYSNDSTALISTLIFLTMPKVIQSITHASVDLILTYFFICAITILLKYLEEPKSKMRFNMVVLLSLLMGFTIFIKIIGVILLASTIIGIFSYWLIYKKKILLKHIIILLLLSLIIVSPYLVRSYIATENPIYPFGYKIFGGKYLSTPRSEVTARLHKDSGLEKNIIDVLLILWNMTFKSERFESTIGTSPFYIMIFPLVLFFYKDIKKKQEWILLFIISASILILIYILVQPNVRYSYSAFALFTILISSILNAIMKHKTLKIIIISLFILSLLFSFLIWWGIHYKDVYFLIFQQSEEEYHANLKDFSPYMAFQWINKNTEPNAKIFLYIERRGYYLDRDYQVGIPDTSYINFDSMDNPADLFKRLKELNISYVFINEAANKIFVGERERENFYNSTWPLVQDLISKHTTLVYNESQRLVYRLS